MDKTTYILGAGFSRFAELPLMNDFYFKSKDIYPKLDDLDKKSFDMVFDYFEKFSKVKHIMNADFYNIEELLSIIEMNAFVMGDNSIKKHYLNYLKKVIEYLTPQKLNDNYQFIIDGGKTTEIYSKFLGTVYGIKSLYDHRDNYIYFKRDADNDNGIISLNYDLILEKSLEKINRSNSEHNLFDPQWFDFDYGLSRRFIDCSERVEPKEKTLRLAKIHGSVNFNKGKLPLIVPPTWNKTSNKEMIPVWKLAHELIAQANELVFIGYSLPATDLYVKYLLISGIKETENLKSIKVICPDKDGTIEKRYNNFFDINYRKKAFKFINKKFEEGYGKDDTTPSIDFLKW